MSSEELTSIRGRAVADEWMKRRIPPLPRVVGRALLPLRRRVPRQCRQIGAGKHPPSLLEKIGKPRQVVVEGLCGWKVRLDAASLMLKSSRKETWWRVNALRFSREATRCFIMDWPSICAESPSICAESPSTFADLSITFAAIPVRSRCFAWRSR
ncbi:MAG: hypothetical protein HYV63_30580 [Candidatus Schekmanbacteria bacterium]|nr:hypothetical protein [Candidatus Schekmanbacteria bacterium]